MHSVNELHVKSIPLLQFHNVNDVDASLSGWPDTVFTGSLVYAS